MVGRYCRRCAIQPPVRSKHCRWAVQHTVVRCSDGRECLYTKAHRFCHSDIGAPSRAAGTLLRNNITLCRECGRCVARYDHHCYWIGTCVGGRNHAHLWCFLLAESTLCAATAGLALAAVLRPYPVDDGFFGANTQVRNASSHRTCKGACSERLGWSYRICWCWPGRLLVPRTCW